MVGIESFAVVFLKGIVGCLSGQSMEGELDTSGIRILRTVDRLDGRIGGVGTGATILIVFIDTHHLKGEVAHIDILSYQ